MDECESNTIRYMQAAQRFGLHPILLSTFRLGTAVSRQKRFGRYEHLDVLIDELSAACEELEPQP